MKADSFQLNIPTEKLDGLDILSLVPTDRDTYALFAVDPRTHEPLVVPTGPDGSPLNVTSVPVVAWGIVKYRQYFGEDNTSTGKVACAMILRGGNLVPAELSNHFVGVRIGEYFCSAAIDAGDEAQTGDVDASCVWYEGRLRNYLDDDVHKALLERDRRAVDPQETP